MKLRIQAIEVHDNKDGTFSLVVPARPLHESEERVLGNLFPNLIDEAYILLQKEALLQAIVKG